MNSSLRILALGAFGLSGVGLAVALAGWQSPSPGRTTAKRTTPAETAPKAAAASTKPPATGGTVQLDEPTSSPLLELPGNGAWVVSGHPPFGQLPTSEPSTSAVETLRERLTGLLAADQQPIVDPAIEEPSAPAAPAEVEEPIDFGDPAAEKPAEPATKTAPEAETVPAPAASSTAVPKDKPSVIGEGDGQLSINLHDTDIHKVLQLLGKQGGLNILATKSVQGSVSASLNNVDTDTALAAILRSTGFVARREGKFIYVGNPQDFQAMSQAGDKISMRIFRPNYIREAELQSLFTPLLTQGTGTIGVTSPAESGIAADGAQVGGDRFAGSDAVVVRDFEAVLVQLDQIYCEVDRRPLQVAIEAMILSVKLSDDYSFGVDFQLLRDKQNIRLASGSPASDLGQVSFSDGGLKFGFLDSSLGAFINALESIGDVNVIATPRVLCVNKQRAEILIGAQKGYVNSTQTETSTTQTVEFLEVGTQLRIRPFISSDGLIRMEVHPELSTGTVSLLGGFTLPEKEVTQVTTNIMVRDAGTAIIGGLMREDLTQTTNRVPLLGSVPGIGFLFRSKKETTERHELIVLITPRIVYDEDMEPEGAHAAGEFHRRQQLYSDQMSPIGARYLGRMYQRKAHDAWNHGDRRTALGAVKLSLHFDPLNRAAIDLRSDILAGNHAGDHSRPRGNVERDSVWVDDEAALGPPHHPLDPGQPGRTKNIVRPETMEDLR